jgi:SAM-dependent methyltransferase
MDSRFLYEKLKIVERILEADGVELIRAIYPRETSPDELKKHTDSYYKWKREGDKAVTRQRKFFDHLNAVLQYTGTTGQMMTGTMEEFIAGLPEAERNKLPENRQALTRSRSRLDEIHLDPHHDTNRMVDSLERSFDNGHIDQRYLYLGPDSVARWKRLITGGAYLTNEECATALHELLRSPRWVSMTAAGNFDAIVDLGSGTGQKTERIAKALLDLNTSHRVLVSSVDTSLYMLEAASIALKPLISEHSDRLRSVGYRADFTDLRKISDKLRGEKSSMFFILGNTFGNTQEHRLLREVKRETRAGDLFVFGAEFLELTSTTHGNDKLLSQFKNEHLADFAVAAVRLLPKDRQIKEAPTGLKVSISSPNEFSDVPGVRSIKIALQLRDRDVVVAYTHRYEEVELRNFVESQSFTYLFDQPSPLNKNYRLVVFKRNDNNDEEPDATVAEAAKSAH